MKCVTFSLFGQGFWPNEIERQVFGFSGHFQAWQISEQSKSLCRGLAVSHCRFSENNRRHENLEMLPAFRPSFLRDCLMRGAQWIPARPRGEIAGNCGFQVERGFHSSAIQ